MPQINVSENFSQWLDTLSQFELFMEFNKII